MVWKILFLILVNISLGYFIWKHFKKAKLQKKLIDKQLNDRIFHIEDSIYEISRATLQEQVEISECVLRLKKLMDLVEIPTSIYERMEPVRKMYVEISGFAILDDRKSLSKQERFEQDKKRFKIEGEYHQDILKCCEELALFYRHKLNPNEVNQ